VRSTVAVSCPAIITVITLSTISSSDNAAEKSSFLRLSNVLIRSCWGQAVWCFCAALFSCIHDDHSDFLPCFQTTTEACEGKIDWYWKSTLDELLEELSKCFSSHASFYSNYQWAHNVEGEALHQWHCLQCDDKNRYIARAYIAYDL
jgi:hypothetical protein